MPPPAMFSIDPPLQVITVFSLCGKVSVSFLHLNAAVLPPSLFAKLLQLCQVAQSQYLYWI